MSGPGASAVLGAVLAGGASRRFGSPKWRAPLAGVTLGGRAVLTLSAALERVVVVSSDPLAGELGRELWADPEPGQGPLMGLLAAVSGAARLGLEGAFVLACDLPLVTPALVSRVLSRRCGRDAVVPLGSAGPEPLCAFYSVAVRPALESALGSGERSPRRLLQEGAFGWLALDDALAVGGGEDLFLNVNTREDLARAERVLRGERAARGTGEPPG